MPSWCNNTIKMQGIAKMSGYFTDGEFDFNKVIPMPEALNIETMFSQEYAIIAYLTDGFKKHLAELEEEKQAIAQKYANNRFMEDWPTAAEEKVKEFVETCRPDLDRLVAEGKVYVHNHLHYGAPTWSEWRDQNWNTSRNACDTRVIDDNTICFDTAWAVPIPVLLKISKDRQTEISGDFWIESGTEGEYKLANGKIVHFERRPITYGVEED